LTPQLAEVLLDDETWESGTPERQNEWRLAIEELIEEHHFKGELPDRFRLLLSYSPSTGLLIDARTIDGHPFARLQLPDEAMADHLREYYEVVREMTRLGGGSSELSPRIEALDIAKRLAHDEAAETIARLLAPLGPDHATCRRLFTLLVTLEFDTTRLALPHHRHR
jgi:uncharacterized protein (UPF0262 family)